MSNALPLSMSNLSVPAPPASRPRSTIHSGAVPATPRPLALAQTVTVEAPKPAAPSMVPVPRTMPERMVAARERLRAAAEAGQRIRAYEVALDLDLSEFHFARQFRAAFGCSPHRYFDEMRAERARGLLRGGMPESDVARRIGFRRPAELRALLDKHGEPQPRG